MGAMGFALATLFFMLLSNALAPAARGASEPSGDSFYAIDGDTLVNRRTGQRYRLSNVDTPETGDRARCGAERTLGQHAARRTRALVRSATRVDIRALGRNDSYGRSVAYILIDGRDLGETLIAEGLARAWTGRRLPWCDAQGNLAR